MSEFIGDKTYLVCEVDLGRFGYTDEYVRWLESELELARARAERAERANLRAVHSAHGRATAAVNERDEARRVARELYVARLGRCEKLGRDYPWLVK